MSSEPVGHAPVCRTDVQLPACARMFFEQEVNAFPEVMSVFVPIIHTAQYSPKDDCLFLVRGSTF
jgi:hypothetical protein